MTPNWVTIHVNGYVEEHAAPPSLADLQGAVRGYLESVPLNGAGRSLTAFCNETGKLDGLRPNVAANAVLSGLLLGEDIIVGPVVLTGAVDRQGELTPLSAKDWAWVERTLARAFPARSAEAGW